MKPNLVSPLILAALAVESQLQGGARLDVDAWPEPVRYQESEVVTCPVCHRSVAIHWKQKPAEEEIARRQVLRSRRFPHNTTCRLNRKRRAR